MDRTFDFGAFQIRAVLKGLIDDQPASQVFVMTPAGQADAGMFATTVPLPSDAALYVVQLLRRVLSMGPQRYLQFTMMREQRKPEEMRAKHQEALRLHAIARGIPGGDAALAQAEAQLQQELEAEKARMVEDAKEVAEKVEKERTIAFDLGPVRMIVKWAGVVPGLRGELAAFHIQTEVPGLAPVVSAVATDTPMFADAAQWVFDEMKKVMEGGPEAYVERERERFKALEKTGIEAATLEDALAYARGLHAVASALGPAGVVHAEQVLAQAAAQEMADAEEAEIRRLEEEQREVRRELDRIRRRKKRPGE